MAECPCKENLASGWLMTRSHTRRGFSWLVGWWVGQFACSSGQTQTGSHCVNLKSSRPTNSRSGFIPVMRRWESEKRKRLEGRLRLRLNRAAITNLQLGGTESKKDECGLCIITKSMICTRSGMISSDLILFENSSSPRHSDSAGE